MIIDVSSSGLESCVYGLSDSDDPMAKFVRMDSRDSRRSDRAVLLMSRLEA